MMFVLFIDKISLVPDNFGYECSDLFCDKCSDNCSDVMIIHTIAESERPMALKRQKWVLDNGMIC